MEKSVSATTETKEKEDNVIEAVTEEVANQAFLRMILPKTGIKLSINMFHMTFLNLWHGAIIMWKENNIT